MVDTDLAARIAALALLVATRLDEDEAAAKAVAPLGYVTDMGGTRLDESFSHSRVRHASEDGRSWIESDMAAQQHFARNDPDRTIRRVKAARELVADIMADEHYDNQNSYYMCSQAEGCSDWDRKGKPCDCGRDERVLRRLEIIAGEWKDG